MEPHLLEDCKKWKIPGTNWVIQGFSQAGNKTGFAIFSLKLLFDAGLPTHKSSEKVLLTHSHSDHSFNIPCIAMGHRKRCIVYCPNEMKEPLHTMCRASQSLNDCVNLLDKEQILCQGIEPGDIIYHRHISIHVIKCFHNVPSVGFELHQIKKVLKKEYKHLQGNELALLKKQGKEICNRINEKKFTFLGDTTIDVFDNKDLLQSKVIMVECTILDNEVSENETKERGHIHWNQLEPIIKTHPETLFVLIHLSRRYDRCFIDSFFKNKPKNIYIW